MNYLEASLKVLVVGLLLGAGLPATFAFGVRSYSAGSGNGTAAPNPLFRAIGVLLFLIVAVVIVVAILWITRTTIQHHFGVNLFPFIQKK